MHMFLYLKYYMHACTLGAIYRNFEEGKQFQVEHLGAQNGVVNTLTRADLKTKYKFLE